MSNFIITEKIKFKLYYPKGSCGSGSNAAEDGGDGDDAVSVVEQLLRDGFRAEAAEVPALDRGDFMPPQAASAAPVLLMDDLGMASDNSRVGSCDLQDPVWAKMNALTGIKQKRKKSDNKPQTQINKCNNEKRRREQENIYIEELAELISANFADMSSLSVKPDKCAILQETVNQIRRIKQQDTANQQIVDPVQQGEVSSSRPTILSNEVYGPLLLEALEGFLFVINSEGKVEHVTDNVVNYIKHTKDEIIGKTIYNFMHPGDHTKFHSNLLPMTIEWGSDQPRSKSIDVRLLVKASDDLDETVEEKTQRVPCYELMHISSTQLRGHLSVSEDDGSDNGPCLLCVASRISHRDKASCFFEQFTTKLDTNGKITCVDTSGVSEAVSQVLRKDFKGRLLRDLVPQQDVHKVTAHLKETLSSGTSVSAVYRIQVAPDKLVSVQTKSKFFKTNPHVNNSEITDFIMATHSIIGDNDSLDPGGGIGGPLMTSIVNGGAPRNGPSNNRDTAPPSSSALIPHASTAGTFTSEFLENDFSTLDFHSTTWELEPSWPDAAKSNSRQSVTPVSTPTPRPPSNPSYSNAPTVVQSPMGHYSAQPSPANQQPTNQNNSNFMPFGIIDDFQEQHVFNVEKDTKVLDETPSHAEPQRLRSLLTNPPTSNASSSSNSNSQQDENRDRILKELLNQQDDEQNGRVDGRNNNSRVMLRGPVAEPPKNIASSSTGNDMLRKLLNDKNDDDDIETKAGMKKSSELLQQLLKKESNEDDEKKNENGPHEDVLLKTLGFPTGSSNSSGNKRSMEDNKDDRGSKRMNNGLQSSSNSSEKSEIYQKNKMLASLLENPTPTPPSIPPIPASVISATPQEKLPRVISDPAKLIPVTMNQGNMRPRMNARQQQATFHRQGAANPPNFIDHIWIENNNDPVLSAILDDFIDFVPDRNILLSENNEGQPTNSFHLSESAAINNIQKILMEVEDSVTSPNVSLPARPPAYSSNNNLVYPPPPNYHQVKYPKAMGVRAGVPQYANPQQQLLLEQQRKIQQREAEEQKRRLLQQQEQQQLVILSNNASAGINPTQTFDSLLNNTVAPNVTLQRSSSLPESQLSPGYSNQLQSSNSLSQTNQRGVVPQSNRQQQQPYSPHSQLPSPLGQQNFQTQTTATGNYSQQQRLSPQSQFNPQLSPRQTYTTQGNGNAAGNWSQQQQQQRLTVQNPMLNAQLTGALTGRGNFQRPPSAQQGQQQRALNSPGGATRHSPFGGDQFAPPSSPTAAFNQNQYLQRLQRANSVPTSSSQMTGGLGSPRPYSGNNQAPPHYPPTHLQSIPSNPMLYTAPQTPIQQDSPYNCYDQQQQTQQPILNVYERRASAPVPHLQPGVASSNPTSEFVRQELRAVVGARTAQAQPGQRSGPTSAQQLQQQLNQSGTVDLESLGLTFEMASGASESPKLWAAMGSDMGSMSPQPATSRNTMEEGRPGDHTKTSLLQQLLSDQSK